MNYYRLYFLNPLSGQIERFVDFEHASDEEALETARAHSSDTGLELWNERRKVARIEPQDVASRLLERRAQHRLRSAADLTEKAKAS